MQLYNFKRLIDKYGVTVQLQKKKGGSYVAGKWVEGDEVIREISGAVVPISERKIYQSGGTLTQNDREWFLPEALTGSLIDYRAIYKGNAYTVEESRDYTDYANVAVYVLKRVNTNVKSQTK